MKKKLLMILLSFVVIIAVLQLTVMGMGINWEKNRQLKEESVTEEATKLEEKRQEYKELEEEVSKKTVQLEKQQDLKIQKEENLKALEQQIQKYKDSSGNIDKEKYLKEKMINCYVENQELLLASQAEILLSMGVDTSFYISYSERDVAGEMTDAVQSAVIDGLVEELNMGIVGDVAGDTISSTVDALRDEVSVDSLYAGITEGLENGMRNVVEGEIQDKINGVIGFDVFAAADLVEQVLGCQNPMPEYLASQISSQMERDGQYLTQMIDQEVFQKQDLEEMITYYEDLCVLAEELYTQTEGEVDVCIDDWEYHLDNMKNIYKQYCINEEIIDMCKNSSGE